MTTIGTKSEATCSCIADDNEFDECLEMLPGVANACCGHGDAESAYVQLLDGSCVRGRNARIMQTILKGGVETDLCVYFLNYQIKNFEISNFMSAKRNQAERELRKVQNSGNEEKTERHNELMKKDKHALVNALIKAEDNIILEKMGLDSNHYLLGRKITKICDIN